MSNAIDFQSHLIGIILAFVSITLSVLAVRKPHQPRRIMLWLGAILTGWAYLSQMEYYIGFEAVRFLLIGLPAWREMEARIMGVLQRLALCYGIGATLALFVSWRTLVGAGAALLFAYWWLMWSFGQGADPYSLQTNAALRLDTWLLGPDHLYHGERVDGADFAFDPEGVLSTVPAIVTFIIGYLTGRFLDRTPDRRRALSELLPAACLLIAAGFLWDYWFGFPINKKIWTSSYTLYAGGWSLLILGLVLWAVDVHGRNGVLSFFNVFGRNPLLTYITSEVGAVTLSTIRLTGPDGNPQSAYAWLYQHTAMPVAGDNAVGSFLFAAGYTLVIWLFAWACHKRGIIIKV